MAGVSSMIDFVDDLTQITGSLWVFSSSLSTILTIPILSCLSLLPPHNGEKIQE